MKLFEWIRRQKWDLALAVKTDGHQWNAPDWHFHIIKAPRDRWFADPFILDVKDDVILVLVEEFSYAIKRGRLAMLTINRQSYTVEGIKIILDLDTHLSFPAILRRGNDVFIYPENSASGKSYIYRLDIPSGQLTDRQLLCRAPLTDAVITNVFGNPLMFSTQVPIQNGHKVFVYRHKQEDKSFEFSQEINLVDNTARGAGDIFTDGNRVIRPAQNCNGGYGRGLAFQQLTIDNEGHLHIDELFRRDPLRGYDGMHTYNQYKGYAIVDLHKDCHPFLHRCLRKLKNVMKLKI